MNILLIIMATVMGLVDFLYPNFKDGFLHYSYILWIVIALARLITYYKPFYLSICKKTALAINAEYIDDFVSDIRYYWDDVKEIYEKNSYLYLKLYKPESYLSKIRSPLKRWTARVFYGAQTDRTPYVINIDLVDINPNVLLELMDDYSIQAD